MEFFTSIAAMVLLSIKASVVVVTITRAATSLVPLGRLSDVLLFLIVRAFIGIAVIVPLCDLVVLRRTTVSSEASAARIITRVTIIAVIGRLIISSASRTVSLMVTPTVTWSLIFASAFDLLSRLTPPLGDSSRSFPSIPFSRLSLAFAVSRKAATSASLRPVVLEAVDIFVHVVIRLRLD
jgi:hypothetical protein